MIERSLVILIPVATVLTACGIETNKYSLAKEAGFMVATVLTACGIETRPSLRGRLL